MRIGPKRNTKELVQKMGRALADGRERHAALPAVTSDAKVAVTRDPIEFPYCDRAAFAKNRELAQRISDAVEELKRSDEHGPHFILAWRLYPNKDHPRWRDDAPHACGCSCGNVAPLGGRKKKKKKTSKRPSARASKTTAKKKSSKKKTTSRKRS